MSAPRGSREARNAGHKTAQAQRFAAAADDDGRLAAAFGWFRSALALLERRRPPFGVSQETHRLQAAVLRREVALYLRDRAEAVDRGDYDAKGAA